MPAPFPSPDDFRDTIRTQFPTLPDIDEPGFASTFDYNAAKQKLWNYGGLVPVGALGAALWYLNQPAKKPAPAAKKKKAILEKQAAPDLGQILENIRWHLPKIRVPDTVAGSLAGAGVGGLYDLIRGKGKDGKRKTLKRVLTGALTGAGLSNLAGDRLRRYISNTKLPLGYTPTAAAEIKPSLKRIWNAAILDKQDFDSEALREWKSRQHDMTRYLPARYELVRHQFGLPVDKSNPWWQKNPEGYYSLNEKSRDYAKRLALLFGSHAHDTVRRDSQLYSGPDKILKNPETALPAFSKYPNQQPTGYDFFGAGPVFGGMQLPFVKNQDGSYSGMAIDRWDLTPSKAESNFMRDNWWKMLTDSKWRKSDLKDNLSWYLKPGQSHTNASAMKALGGRLMWDNVLSDELPWIGQKFHIAPNAKSPTLLQNVSGRATYAPNTLQFLKADNSPATPAMDFDALDTWIKNK